MPATRNLFATCALVLTATLTAVVLPFGGLRFLGWSGVGLGLVMSAAALVAGFDLRRPRRA